MIEASSVGARAGLLALNADLPYIYSGSMGSAKIPHCCGAITVGGRILGFLEEIR